MQAAVLEKGPYRTWELEEGMRYRIPLVNGTVAEGTFTQGVYIGGNLIFSDFIDARVPGYRVHNNHLILYHPDANEPLNMRIEFFVEDETNEHTRRHGGQEINIDVSQPPMSLENVNLVGAREFRNAYVFGRQAHMLPPELKDTVMDYTKIPFGPMRKFGGRKTKQRRRGSRRRLEFTKRYRKRR